MSLLAVLAFAALARPAVSGFYASKFLAGNNSRDITAAMAITGEDARYSRALGCLYQNASGTTDLEKAADYYRESLSENPLDAQTWLSLARVYDAMGKKRLMKFALKKALHRSAGDPRTIWDSGVLLFETGNTSEAVAQLKKYICIRPEEQQKVYSLCITLGLAPRYMQENLVPKKKPFLRQWLGFLIDSGLTQAASPAWSELRRAGPERSDYLGYCGFLIENGRFLHALAVWNEFLLSGRSGSSPGAELSHKAGQIWNGGFDLPPLERGFDWKIGKAEGVRIFLDRSTKWGGRYSLGASFDGTSNPDICLARQVVLVEAGHAYTVTGYLKTSGITSDSGIFFEVKGYKCQGLDQSSKPVTGTTPWEEKSVEFRVPAECRAVTVGVKRAASTSLDNRISGDTWADSIHITGPKEQK